MLVGNPAGVDMDSKGLIGRTIAHYKIEEKLGEGGMGVVYRALDLHLDRPVAIKVLRPEAVADPERKRRFVQEAKAASALNHPNIITIYDIDTADGITYIAMEYVAGKTLTQRIGRKGLPLAETLKYAVQVAGALSAAHEIGIVHRDLKPTNIMATEKGLIKVLDFGLAKLVEPQQTVADEDATDTVSIPVAPKTQNSMVIGTAAYMSPEQAEGKKLDPRSDIFSFGSVLYEMLTGRRPFQGETPLGMLSAIISKEPTPISEILPEAPREVDRLVARCLRKDLERRPQHMADLLLTIEELKEELAQGRLVSGPPPAVTWARRSRTLALVSAAVVVALAAGGMAWWGQRPQAPPARRILVRLTSDSGLSAYPALSSDGKLIAYASDRAGGGNLDLWIRQVAGGEPIRLTQHEADDYEPSFSPDGTIIVFRSERDGGGVYLIPALGGEARLIAGGGRRPRFSPDGKWIAYWKGVAGGAGVGEEIYLVSTSGEAARRWQPQFGAASHPVWSPDGKRILFLGKRDPNARWPDTADWWVAPVEPGEPAPVGAIDLFGREAFVDFLTPELWTSEGNTVLFSRKLGDTTNVWEVALSPRTAKLVGPPHQLTSGTGLEIQPSMASAGRLVFSSLVENMDIWGLPVDANRGQVTGELKRFTNDLASDQAPSVSLDGKKIAFISSRLGNYDVWLYEAKTGRQAPLTSTPAGKEKMFPVIFDDGSQVAYGLIENQKEIYVVWTSGGMAERVCADCGLARSWSPDGTQLIYQGGEPRHLGLLTLSSRARNELLRHPRHGLYSARFSPDGRWIAFFARIQPNQTRIYVAPFPGTPGKFPIPESEWTPTTSGEFEDDKPRWSPDGNLLYFTSLRDGFRCIWAQRLDPETKKPAGVAFAIQHFHQARSSMIHARLDFQEVTVARDKVVFSLVELTGNIWLSKTEQAQ